MSKLLYKKAQIVGKFCDIDPELAETLDHAPFESTQITANSAYLEQYPHRLQALEDCSEDCPLRWPFDYASIPKVEHAIFMENELFCDNVNDSDIRHFYFYSINSKLVNRNIKSVVDWVPNTGSLRSIYVYMTVESVDIAQMIHLLFKYNAGIEYLHIWCSMSCDTLFKEIASLNRYKKLAFIYLHEYKFTQRDAQSFTDILCSAPKLQFLSIIDCQIPSKMAAGITMAAVQHPLMRWIEFKCKPFDIGKLDTIDIELIEKAILKSFKFVYFRVDIPGFIPKINNHSLMARLIANNSPIKVIRFQADDAELIQYPPPNPIDDSLHCSIAISKTLKCIDVDGARFPITLATDFVNSMARILYVNKCLRELRMAYFVIDDQDLSKCDIRKLDLHKLAISKAESDRKNSPETYVEKLLPSEFSDAEIAELLLFDFEIAFTVFANALEHNRGLLILDLTGALVTSYVCNRIVDGMMLNNFFHTLNLSHNERAMNLDNLRHLGLALQRNITLKILDLSHNGLTDMDVNFLVGLWNPETHLITDGMFYNRSLLHLNLSYNKLYCPNNFLHYLKNNRTLRDLDLMNNRLDHLALYWIEKYLRSSTRLRFLALDYDNEVSEEYGERDPYMIAYNIIRFNKSIQHLKIKGRDSPMTLFRALRFNRNTLRRLEIIKPDNVRKISITDEEYNLFCRSTDHNFVIDQVVCYERELFERNKRNEMLSDLDNYYD